MPTSGVENNEVQTLTKKERQQMVDLFDALLGVMSECGSDFFDSYHKRKGKGMFTELETFLCKYAPQEVKELLGE